MWGCAPGKTMSAAATPAHSGLLASARLPAPRRQATTRFAAERGFETARANSDSTSPENPLPCRPGFRPKAQPPQPMPVKRIVPLIVAVALFMENMDSTVIATSLPAIAADIGTSPLTLKLAVTSYLLSLAIFIPVSGWTADRFGARTVFRAAIAVFMLGSIGCALSGSLAAVRRRPHRRGHGRGDDDAGRPPDPGAQRRPARTDQRHGLGHAAGA